MRKKIFFCKEKAHSAPELVQRENILETKI
jgi:hypothetical protein